MHEVAQDDFDLPSYTASQAVLRRARMWGVVARLLWRWVMLAGLPCVFLALPAGLLAGWRWGGGLAVGGAVILLVWFLVSEIENLLLMRTLALLEEEVARMKRDLRESLAADGEEGA